MLSLVAKYPNGSFIFNKGKLSKCCPEIVPSLVVGGSQISGLNGQDRRTKMNSTPDSSARSARYENCDSQCPAMIDSGDRHSTNDLCSIFDEQSNRSSSPSFCSTFSNGILSSNIQNRSSMISTETNEGPKSQGTSNPLNCHRSVSRKEGNPNPRNQCDTIEQELGTR